VIPTIVTQALTRDVVELGSTDTMRDFLFVADTAAGIARAGAAAGVEGEVINLGTGSEVAVGDVVRRALALVGRDIPVVLDERRLRPSASEVERLVADVSKAERLLGWRAAVSFDDGLKQTIDWISRSLERYDPTTYVV
jgi:dTDP-glucose 4,6-dehydratase